MADVNLNNDKLTQQEVNDICWRACDTFRGVIDGGQYKDYILVMLFIKYISDYHANVVVSIQFFVEGYVYFAVVANGISGIRSFSASVHDSIDTGVYGEPITGFIV